MIYWKNRGDLTQRAGGPITTRAFTRPILPPDWLISAHFNREIAKITGLWRRSSDESCCWLLLSAFLTSSASQVDCLSEYLIIIDATWKSAKNAAGEESKPRFPHIEVKHRSAALDWHTQVIKQSHESGRPKALLRDISEVAFGQTTNDKQQIMTARAWLGSFVSILVLAAIDGHVRTRWVDYCLIFVSKCETFTVKREVVDGIINAPNVHLVNELNAYD